jgi:hypothetical protein
MKNKTLLILFITAFINVFIYCCPCQPNDIKILTESPYLETQDLMANNPFSLDQRISNSSLSQKFPPDLPPDSSNNIDNNENQIDYTDEFGRIIKCRNFILIGPVFGINFPYFSNIELPTNNYTKAYEVKNANGNGFYFGLCLLLPLGDYGNQLIYEKRYTNSFLGFELSFDEKYFKNEKFDIINISQQNNSTINVPVKNSSNFHLYSTNLNIIYNYFPFKSNFFLCFKIGLGINNLKSSQILEITSIDKNVRFLEENNIKYKDDGRTMVINDGKIPDFVLFRLSASPLLGYDFLTNTRMTLRISGGYDYNFISLRSNTNWNYRNIFAGVSFLFSFYSRNYLYH